MQDFCTANGYGPDGYVGTGDTACNPGPQCARARSDLQLRLARWEVEAQGAGAGRLAGYAGAEANRHVRSRNFVLPSCAAWGMLHVQQHLNRMLQRLRVGQVRLCNLVEK